MTNVSVIITSKNEAEYLDRSIGSVLSQTHQPNEIVIVDAASEDGSQSVIREYSNENPIIKCVLLSEDPGIPKMRNIALEHATGDVYTFLDGDDWFYPKKVEHELSTFQNNQHSRIVYSNFRYVDEDGSSRRVWITSDNPPRGNVLSDVLTRNWPDTKVWRSALVERSLVEAVGLYDEEMDVYEDWELRIRLAQEAQVAYCDEILSSYRIHKGGVSVQSSAETHVQSLHHMLKKHRFTLENQSDPEIRRAFKKMERIVHRRSVFAHASERNRLTTLNMYFRLLLDHPESVADYKLHLKTFLPVTVFDQLVRFYNLLRSSQEDR